LAVEKAAKYVQFSQRFAFLCKMKNFRFAYHIAVPSNIEKKINISEKTREKLNNELDLLENKMTDPKVKLAELGCGMKPFSSVSIKPFLESIT